MPVPPPIPSWEGAHVLVVHMPIGLLLIAPLLLIAGMFPGRWRDGLRVAALLLLLIGTIGAFVAKESGEAAANLADRTPAISEILEQHEELAQLTCIVFAAATTAYAAFLLFAFFSKGAARTAISVPAQLLVLAALCFGVLAISSTGHLGGRLVHEMGVRAMVQ